MQIGSTFFVEFQNNYNEESFQMILCGVILLTHAQSCISVVIRLHYPSCYLEFTYLQDQVSNYIFNSIMLLAVPFPDDVQHRLFNIQLHRVIRVL